MKKEETTNHTERSNLWNSIYELVKELPRANVEGDAVDYSSLTTSLEKLFASQQSDRRKELIRYADFLTLKGWSDFAIDEEILDDCIESHPEPAKVEQQIKEKGE